MFIFCPAVRGIPLCTLNSDKGRGEKMKFIKQSPLFLLLLVSGFLLTLIAIVGKDNIYDEQEYDP